MSLDPRKITLCWPNHIEAAALAGGAWQASLPLTHVQDPVFAVRARSLDLAPSSTRLTATLSRSRPTAVVSLAAHNLSATAEWRVTVFADAAGSELLYDSGMIAVWPPLYQSPELEWEYDNFWLGTLSEDDRGDFTALATHFFDMQVARRVDVEISDPSNSAGWIELGRVLIADAWQPTYNASYGIQHGHEITTEFETAGDPEQTRYADPKRPKRTVQLSLDHLDEQEAVQTLLGMQRRQGLHREVLFAVELRTTPESWRRTFIGTLTQADPLTHPYHATYTNTLNLLEVL